MKMDLRKRVGTLIMSAVMAASLLPGAAAAAPTKVVAMKIGSPWCVMGTEVSQLDQQSDKVSPVAEGGRTLVPISRVLAAFGGTAQWVPETGGVRCSLNGTEVELSLGSTTALVDGEAVALDVPAKAMNNRTFVPVRFVSESLGLKVGYEPTNRIVVVADGDLDTSALSAMSQVRTLVEKTRPRGEATTLTAQSYKLASGTVSAKVITVDMTDPRVSVKANVPWGMLNATRGFSDICKASGATAVINANFFEAYQTVKDPIGHVMVNGQFVYGSSGHSALGITSTGEMRYGRPAVFFRVKTVDEGTAQQWAGFELNVTKQFKNQSVVYTPARGKSITIDYPGVVLTVTNGVTTGYQAVSAGQTVAIPSNGFLLYSSQEVTKTDYYRVPEMGRKVVVEPYLYQADAEGFTLDGVQTIVSGAPRLVKDGKIETYVEPAYAKDSRFTTSSAPRTAVGSTANGKLLLVSVSSATIQQMRELMLKLGCVDAVNLDGGGSTAMYYKGQTLAAPGRALVTTLQVFVDQ